MDMEVPKSLIAASVTGDNPLLLFGMAVVATTVVVVFTRRRAARSSLSPRADARRALARAQVRPATPVDDEVRDLMIQLERLAREVSVQMDNRYQRLEVVMRDADLRIARLERLLQTTPGTQDRSPAHGIDVTIADDGPRQTPAPSRSHHAARGEERMETGHRSVPDHDTVYRLSAQGLAPVDIAKRMGCPTGEVELVLSLRPSSAR